MKNMCETVRQRWIAARGANGVCTADGGGSREKLKQMCCRCQAARAQPGGAFFWRRLRCADFSAGAPGARAADDAVKMDADLAAAEEKGWDIDTNQVTHHHRQTRCLLVTVRE